MDSKELRGLLEAYAEVYTPIDELYKGKHGQSETEYMDSRSDAGKQISGTSKLSGAAYSHRSFKGVGKPAKPGERQQHQGKMTPADRNELAIRRAALKKEDLEIDEAVKGESSERRQALAAERKAGHRPLSAKEGERYASHKLAQIAYVKRKRMGEELDIFDVVLEFLQAEGYAETLEEAEWLMANVIDEEAIEIIAELTGGKGHPGYKAGSKDHGPMQAGHPADSEKRKDKGGTMSMRHGYHLGDMDDKDDDDDGLETIVKQQSRDSRERTRKPLRNKVRAARKVLSKEEYVDEAQEARNNPEKYEREQSKKYAPVRGERTPMPPRGDKRREDFEKWYRANVH